MRKKKAPTLRELLRYEGGGPMQPADYASLGMFAGNLMEAATPVDKVNVGASFLKGAGTGAATGAMLGKFLGPKGAAAGAVVGGVVGGATGLFKGFNDKEAARDAERRMISNRRKQIGLLSTQRLQGYDMFGTAESEYATAEMGGYVPLNKSMSTGGDLKRLASDAFEVEGKTHAEGGVKFPADGVELEDNETLSGDYVFSDFLGFADRHKKIAKQLGKIEKKPLTRATKSSILLLRKKELALKNEQEAVREELGLNMQEEGVPLSTVRP